jgi:hypothetical protein
MKDGSIYPTYVNGIEGCGLTKRELFAAMAMQAVIPVLFSGVKIKDTSLNGESLAAAQAVEYADALLAALEGKWE